jgi:hypothetical protein
MSALTPSPSVPMLTNGEMVAKINAGYSVVYKGRIITTLAGLPSDATIAADVAASAAAAPNGPMATSATATATAFTAQAAAIVAAASVNPNSEI